MNAARTQRNEEIGKRYTELLKSGSSVPDALQAIYNSAENKSWCLEYDTIRLIATYKDYGKQRAKPRRSVKN